MYAIVEVAGKQYRAEAGREIVVDRLAAAPGETIRFAPLLAGDGSGIKMGADAPEVVARVVEHFRGPKLVVFKHKPKRGFQRKTGFRSALTRIAVDSIGDESPRAEGAEAPAETEE
jgi:large subunit ribosomal protein L21